MSKHNRCPICNGTAKTVRRAFISPWVRNLGGIHQRRSKYCLCSSCESGFFDYRYSAAEMEGIYSDYRGARYLRARQEWEPSYTRSLNDSLGSSNEVLHLRHQFVLSALPENRRRAIQRVIDVGGDRGQFIPPDFPERFVLDVSGKELVEGVQRISSLVEAGQVAPNLVMACGVLEHVPQPIELMKDLRNIATNERHALIYIEVPGGVPTRRSFWSQQTATALGSVASRLRPLWAMLDSMSARQNLPRSISSNFMPMRQSEHINFFSRLGLENLTTSVGMRVLLLDEIAVPSMLLDSGRVQFSSTLRLLVELGDK
jgi:hypothetical protein